jgi:hypothetical protein
VLFAGWLLPGAGHWLLGQKPRAVGFLLAVGLTFLVGLGLTRGHAVSPAAHPVALVAELPAGIAAIVPAALEVARGPVPESALSREVVSNLDLGMLFCMMAGLWNVLLVHDAWERAVERRTRR